MSVRHSVLLVDENAQARRHMVAILRGVFAQVYEAEDYESALCLFSKHRPDMVITAIKEYPAVLEFIGRICGQEPAAVIVALIEARVPAAKLIGSVNAGVTGFLRKPATLNDLRALSAR
ncbi:MAG TPA: response regulator, partial [Oligoflexia bacterium]|nr:response regulator [Oligoflexia bacterium]